MAAHYAISPAEDDAVIRQRLLTRTTTTRGEPPLKKLIKKFTALVGEIEKEESKYAECEKLYRSLLQELATFELPLLKTKAVIEANRREQESFKELHVELKKQISQVRRLFGASSWRFYCVFSSHLRHYS
jgi:THO complex subunit 7